ncbi:MAG: transcriptional repressor [Bacteroidales bacterium]|jgi:Fur family ferric uptake transcriptional regulator|nr:transcriptional repressor [Bacteroidales bacterium]
MSDYSEAEARLTKAGVRVTAVRLLIWRTLTEEEGSTFCLQDIEDRLSTVDKSTIFRTIVTFQEAGLLHETDDGSGKQKYCVCHCHDGAHHVGHVHVTCRVCHKTYCLRDVEIPAVVLPVDFVVEETEYVVKGVCPDCKRRRDRDL